MDVTAVSVLSEPDDILFDDSIAQAINCQSSPPPPSPFQGRLTVVFVTFTPLRVKIRPVR